MTARKRTLHEAAQAAAAELRAGQPGPEFKALSHRKPDDWVVKKRLREATEAAWYGDNGRAVEILETL